MRHWGLAVVGMASGLVGCASTIPMAGGRYYDAPFTEATMTGIGDRPVSSDFGEPSRAAPALSAEVPRRLAAAEGDRTRNTGWRMGVLYVVGDLADWLDENAGGAGPVLSAWGYQFEIERGAEGETKALVEIVPAIIGLESSMIIPTVNVLVGLRFPNRFEFGAGPHFAPRVYSHEYEDPPGSGTMKRSYPKDDIHLWGLGLTVGVGYTFERNEGRMRIPIGLAAGFASDATIISLTIGWNMQEW